MIGGEFVMLSLEQKKAIFSMFDLEEKKLSNGRIDYEYPASKQRGKKIATQLYKSGNGYVIGKYMSEESIKANQYEVDPRGWINIMDFSSDELKNVIIEAMISMSGTNEIGFIQNEVESASELLVAEQIIQIEETDLNTSKINFGCSLTDSWYIYLNGQLKILDEVQNFRLRTETNLVKGILSFWEELYPVKRI